VPEEDDLGCDIKDSPCWCVGCTYKILLQVETSDTYVITAKTSKDNQELKDGIPI
jgi:hypothetical protein